MQNITSIEELKNAIQLLEVEQTEKGKELKAHLLLTVEGFKPANLISGALTDMAKSPLLIENIVGTVMGLATGYLSKSVFIGASGSKIKRLVGSILQFGITNVIVNNSDTIKTFGKLLFHNILRKKKLNNE